jgi:hypothetical protein
VKASIVYKALLSISYVFMACLHGAGVKG